MQFHARLNWFEGGFAEAATIRFPIDLESTENCRLDFVKISEVGRRESIVGGEGLTSEVWSDGQSMSIWGDSVALENGGDHVEPMFGVGGVRQRSQLRQRWS